MEVSDPVRKRPSHMPTSSAYKRFDGIDESFHVALERRTDNNNNRGESICSFSTVFLIDFSVIINIQRRDGLVGYDDCLTRSRSRVRLPLLVRNKFLFLG